ncbi:hypothetical protein EJ03DRAFT_40439 [Teratosphaeria nubilosa]|uniref:Uncharacterized protein n=1 Tax=Teratosphaeria nubilosa TaxID=161662 RepID=A0A6G1KVQ4_9PEZI|nr:hypothetical protein EJ03DRAFT_40439 [Teratosphaeria nubilosa]
MEGHDPSSQRQYAPNTYAAQQNQQATAQVPSQYGSSGSTERFRHSSYLQQSPTAPSSLGRAGSDGQLYGFQQSAYASMPMQQSSMQYAQGVQQSHDATRQAQQNPYQQYSTSSMYGMAGVQTPQQQQSNQTGYESVGQYRQRPSSHSETLATGFGVPQASYYIAGQNVPTSAAPGSDLTGQLSASYTPTAGYQQAAASTQQTYPSTMIDPTQASAYATYTQQSQYNSSQSTSSGDQAFNEYQQRVRSIFTMVREGTLRDIGTHLLQISQYLLGNAEALGLTRDDDSLHDERIRLWDEFNRAWLATLQRQHDLTEEMLQTQQQLREPQSIMSQQALEHLSRELVRLCDSVERHGLVDYQMGVSEEEIMDLIIRCLNLIDPSGAAERSSEPNANPESTAGASRSR